jgi:hypothetical protein
VSAIYGQDHLGDVEATAAGYVARDSDGKRIGTYRTSKQAVAACMANARKPKMI